VTQPDEVEFLQWAVARRGALRRAAYLLTLDWHAADDLVQETLVKVCLAWRRSGPMDSVDAYARRVMVHAMVDARRRPWRREVSYESVPDRLDAAGGDATGAPLQDQVVEALRGLPVAQRTVLVLRFWEDLSVEQTAELLGRPVGTVKSQASRGLDALRTLMTATTPINEEGRP
jgi:RNA polymerase sigma-70 factor (sigma-E family)